MTAAATLFRSAQAPRSPYAPFAFLAAYAVSATLAYTMTVGAGGLAVLWINNGLLAAALLLLPRHEAAPVAALCTITDFLSALISGSPPSQALLIASVDLFEAVLAAMLIRRFCGAALDVTVMSRFRSLILFAVLPATLIAGTLGTAVSSLALGHDFVALWPTWVVGDLLGMLIGLPTALLLARYRRHDVARDGGALERAGLVLLMPATAALLFMVAPSPLLFMVFPLGLLAVIRLNAPLAILAVLLFAFVAAAATITDHGPIAAATPDMSLRILMLQFYLAMVQLSALVLLNVLNQRARAQNGLKRALVVSRQTRLEAQAASGAKGRFLAVMSHEMRTPLNGIAGYAQILDASDDLPERAREHVGTIRASCEVLLSLINDVLDYSRTETHQLALTARPLSMSEIIGQTVDIVRPLLADRPVSLMVDSAMAPGERHLGDARRLEQVLLNLLGNAIKFTAAGQITIGVTLSGAPESLTDRITVRVTDTGIGIAPDDLALLFKPFSQVDAGMTRNVEGAGLGLAISRSLVELMGGQIGVDSQPGQGSTFWFSLALARAGAAAPEPRLDAPALVPPRSAVAARRVLVVDDHEVNRRVAALMLEAAGFAVAMAEDGEQAVQAVRAGKFDLVLMDLHMPVKDGLTACQEIRALPDPVGRIPIVAMTAAAMPDDIARCRAAGMGGHIAKPIQREDFILTVEAATTPVQASR